MPASAMNHQPSSGNAPVGSVSTSGGEQQLHHEREQEVRGGVGAAPPRQVGGYDRGRAGEAEQPTIEGAPTGWSTTRVWTLSHSPSGVPLTDPACCAWCSGIDIFDLSFPGHLLSAAGRPKHPGSAVVGMRSRESWL
jgi:hypothetical protein